MLNKVKASTDKLLKRKQVGEDVLANQDNELRGACQKMFGTPEGLIFLKWFYTSTHIGDLKKAMSGDVALAYRAQQNIYDSIKNYLPIKARIAIELKGAEND